VSCCAKPVAGHATVANAATAAGDSHGDDAGTHGDRAGDRDLVPDNNAYGNGDACG
jgi:hypothetical protein